MNIGNDRIYDQLMQAICWAFPEAQLVEGCDSSYNVDNEIIHTGTTFRLAILF